AVPALDGELARVAVAAEDLDRPLGRPHRHLTSLQLAHRALGVLEWNLVSPHPRGPPNEQADGVDLELHPRQSERDRLVLDDLAAELLALLGVLQRVLVRRPRNAESLRGDGRPGGLERLHRRLAGGFLALAHAGDPLLELFLATEDVSDRNAAVVEKHVRGV